MPAGRACTTMLLAAACLLAGCGGAASSSSSSASSPTTTTATAGAATTATASASPSQQPLGPEGIPLEAGPPLAPASSTTPGTPVDGVQCAPIEQLVYHIHSHLLVYADGQPRELPAAIGLLGPVAQETTAGPFYGAQQCYYWLHTHTSDGIIHIESPSKRVYTLGNFFDEWRQPLSATQVASVQGKVTAFLNGKRWTRDPRVIPLLPHGLIQLDVGSPIVAPQPISFAGTNL
ncbi:MAG: hypothetical protein JO363_16040 [Solirubrobacterales bacterium]|nr:hypothetical protein [Solirubrobacterales bacterium]